MALVVDELISARSGRPVHPPVAFTLEPGDALLLRGANGSGKTTLLRTLAGFLRPHGGGASWAGRPIADPAWPLARHWLGHANALKVGLTVGENLQLAAALASGGDAGGYGNDPFALALLHDRLAGQLSQGQRRRAALARLLSQHRPVWLLDEPAVGLDAGSTASLVRLVADHRATGGLVVIASHGDVTLADALVLDL